ncbi:hypothetical protein DO97_06765 [Neosynechococcus sphagnicola sy1]|uniref:Uncharacterized protein n=1 Tax=Neosynechococcus sphagnicola sy1 TaxID=1497020 RepID=A0A098TK76_9CYAN|nr:hypothetical protein [Neosynechococcus sphagnicola]KGF72709.1 hypothetical protein DO97_06765 [Neosynechococcus sphagnicola sy1]
MTQTGKQNHRQGLATLSRFLGGLGGGLASVGLLSGGVVWAQSLTDSLGTPPAFVGGSGSSFSRDPNGSSSRR